MQPAPVLALCEQSADGLPAPKRQPGQRRQQGQLCLALRAPAAIWSSRAPCISGSSWALRLTSCSSLPPCSPCCPWQQSWGCLCTGPLQRLCREDASSQTLLLTMCSMLRTLCLRSRWLAFGWGKLCSPTRHLQHLPRLCLWAQDCLPVVECSWGWRDRQTPAGSRACTSQPTWGSRAECWLWA